MLLNFVEQIILSPLIFWEQNSLQNALILFLFYFGLISCIGRSENRTQYSILAFSLIFSYLCGLTPLLSIFFINIAALAVGIILINPKNYNFFNIIMCVFVGFSLFIFAMTFFVYFNLNYQIFYLVALLIPIFIKRKTLIEILLRLRNLILLPLKVKTFDYILINSLFFIILIQVIYAVAPEKGFDALTTHLMLPTHISFNHSIQIDFKRFVPLLMPSGADWIYSLGYLFGGETAAKLVNFNFYILILINLFYLGTIFLEKRVAFMACLLFASTPLTGLESATLFVENALTYFFIVSVIIILDKTSNLSILKRSFLLGIGLGIAAQIKLFGFLFYPVIFPMYILLVDKKYRFSSFTLVIAPLIALAIASPPYIYAYIISGNPIFPFYNVFFKSPYFPLENFSNVLYLKPIDWTTPFKMTLQSSSFLESHNGSFGIQNILFPFAFILPFIMRQRQLIVLSVVCLVYIAIVFTQQRYLRYIYPILPLTSIFMLCWAGRELFQKKLSQGLFLLVIVLNLYLFPTSLWFFRNFPFPDLFQSKSRQLQSIPIRRAIEVINLTHGASSKVLLLGDPFSAGLEGKFDTLTWYSPKLTADFMKANSVESVKELILKEKYTHIINSNAHAYPHLKDIAPFINSTFSNKMNIDGTIIYFVQ